MADDPLVVNNQPGPGGITGEKKLKPDKLTIDNVSDNIQARREGDDTIVVDFKNLEKTDSTRATKTKSSQTGTPPPKSGSTDSTNPSPAQDASEDGDGKNNEKKENERNDSPSVRPKTINNDEQQAASKALARDRQKQPDQAAENAPNQKMIAPKEEANPDNLMKGDLGKGEIGEGPSRVPAGAPPELSPADQSNAAANNASQTQSDQRQQQMTQLQQQEAQIKDSIQSMKGTILSGKWMRLLRKIPLVRNIVSKLESTAKKGVKAAIQALEKIKFLAKTAKTMVAIGEVWVNYFKMLASLCGTGIGIIIAIIIALPGLFFVTILAIIFPQGVSKTARLINSFIKEIDTILKPLKKFYNTTEQKKASLLKVRQLMASVQNTRIEPPPGPS